MIMSIYPIERQLDIIGHKYEEAKSLFTKIYDEYVESDEFQQWATRKSNCHIDYKAAKEAWEATYTYKHSPYKYCSDCSPLVKLLRSWLRPYGRQFPAEDENLYREYARLLNYRHEFSIEPPDSFAFNKYKDKIRLLENYMGYGTGHRFPNEWYTHPMFQYIRPRGVIVIGKNPLPCNYHI